ncbi:hypothetical protein NW762_013414 [Fusarium torreyae]|uniref:Uncharacterized protein n=1 Tax=Fusarium torreyae TaxID=1237075 RepID=A0A9W8V7I6_9HYPO|nr:hypothetical protein NW762_013414 [Fusarium torreyae]
MSDLDALDIDQYRKLHRSIALTQYQLFTASAYQTGCLTFDSSNTVCVGHISASFGSERPSPRATDYFLTWAKQEPKFQNLDYLVDPKSSIATDTFPEHLSSTIQRLHAHRSDWYPIVHADFLLHDILFDDNLEVSESSTGRMRILHQPRSSHHE